MSTPSVLRAIRRLGGRFLAYLTWWVLACAAFITCSHHPY